MNRRKTALATVYHLGVIGGRGLRAERLTPANIAPSVLVANGYKNHSAPTSTSKNSGSAPHVGVKGLDF